MSRMTSAPHTVATTAVMLLVTGLLLTGSSAAAGATVDGASPSPASEDETTTWTDADGTDADGLVLDAEFPEPGACPSTDVCWDRAEVLDTDVHPAGLLGSPGNLYALSSQEAAGAQYIRGSNVLELADGRWMFLPPGATEPVIVEAGDRAASAQIAESRAWLTSGEVPGATDAQREMAERALLDLRLLLQDNGAVAAAWHGIWRYSWPRDSSFVAVAFARAGFTEEAVRILRYLMTTQREDGTWEARTILEGTTAPDEREWQLDANGWVPWAVWQVSQTIEASEVPAFLAELYPMVAAAAGHAAASLDADGLPPARPDYWESSYPAPNLGTAAPLLAGLHASVALARLAGHEADAMAWTEATERLAHGVHTSFGATGYQRTTSPRSGADSAITFLAPPFLAADEVMWARIDTVWQILLEPTGGVKPGERWSGAETWTPETMFFALAWAHGDAAHRERAVALVDWLGDHRTAIGTFPEKVTPHGRPAAVAPLGWTASLAVLTLAALDEPLALAEEDSWPATAGPYREAADWPLVVLAGAATLVAVACSRRRRRRHP